MTERLSDDRIRHLEMLQSAIARMAGAAAAIKSLSLIVVAGALAFVASTQEPALALYAAFLTLTFWLLDARYLQQEKWFRDMFDLERKRAASDPASFLMTPTSEIRAATSIAYGLKSWSTWGLYLPVIIFLLILWFVIPGVAPAAAGGCPHA